jgi:hypothetical protein
MRIGTLDGDAPSLECWSGQTNPAALLHADTVENATLLCTADALRSPPSAQRKGMRDKPASKAAYRAELLAWRAYQPPSWVACPVFSFSTGG